MTTYKKIQLGTPPGGIAGQVLTQTASGVPAWVNPPAGAGGAALPSGADGQVLTYSAATSSWVPADAKSGSGATVSTDGLGYATVATAAASTPPLVTKTILTDAVNTIRQVPAGGIAGQVLKQTDSGPVWGPQAGPTQQQVRDAGALITPSGGTDGQFLGRSGGAVTWVTPAAAGGTVPTGTLVAQHGAPTGPVTTPVLDLDTGLVYEAAPASTKPLLTAAQTSMDDAGVWMLKGGATVSGGKLTIPDGGEATVTVAVVEGMTITGTVHVDSGADTQITCLYDGSQGFQTGAGDLVAPACTAGQWAETVDYRIEAYGGTAVLDTIVFTGATPAGTTTTKLSGGSTVTDPTTTAAPIDQAWS